MLITTADLSLIDQLQFQLLVEIFNGDGPSDAFAAKEYLLNTIHASLSEVDEYQDVLEELPWGPTPTSPTARAQIAWGPQGDRSRIRQLFSTIEKLDEVTCIALLSRVDEVLANPEREESLLPRCEAVYQKMQQRQKL